MSQVKISQQIIASETPEALDVGELLGKSNGVQRMMVFFRDITDISRKKTGIGNM